MIKIALLSLFGLGLAGAWGGLMIPSMSGYGYAGYRGWQARPSFFYMNSVSTFHSRSVRGTSRAGVGGGK